MFFNGALTSLPQTILLDIEGTTTPMEFVHQVLFPFARTHVESFLEDRWSDAAVGRDIEGLRKEHAADRLQGNAPPAWQEDSPGALHESVLAYFGWLMDRDRKSPALKSLQGKIWEAGYRDGLLKGEVYQDVPRAFERWRRRGKDISIFSSGSTLAQKLLFGYSNHGDLTPMIRAFFDTQVGSKADVESYRQIAARLELAAPNILFISDVTAELDAAREAGMQTALCVRSATRPLSAHPIVHSLDEIV